MKSSGALGSVSTRRRHRIRKTSRRAGTGRMASVFIVSPSRMTRDTVSKAASAALGTALAILAVSPDDLSPLTWTADVALVDAAYGRGVGVAQVLCLRQMAGAIGVFAVNSEAAHLLRCRGPAINAYSSIDDSVEAVVRMLEMILQTPTCYSMPSVHDIEVVARPATFPIAALLSLREREIATLLAQGLTNKEIAGALHIEVTTVKSHVHRVLRKLGLRSRVDVKYVLRIV